MKLKKIAMAAAVSAVLGMAGQAQAAEGALAQANLDVTNFALGTYAGGVFTPFSTANFTQLSILDSAFNNAILNGVPVGNAAASAVVGATVDALQACVGVCGGQNNFTPVAAPPASLFSRSDSVLFGTPITIVAPPVAAGATARTIAEVSIPGGTNNGSAGSQINLTATINFVLGTTVTNGAITFDADNFLRAWTAAGSVPGTAAGANTAWSISLQGGGVNIQWNPNGVVGGGTFTGLTEISDACNLTDNVSASFNQPNAAVTCAGSFLAVTSGVTLVAGVNYSLNIQHSSQAQASSVPEPTSLALLGIGLLGLGFGALRKKSA